MPDSAVLRRFASSLRGSVVLPDDAGYDDARAVWNASIDRRPAAVARCADVTDVQRAVDFARTHDLRIAVRGGGHGFAGHATCDGGLVIDCSPMRDVTVDVPGRIARVAAGCTLGELDQATQAFGLASPTGTAPPTGVAGLTLGGGLGWLMGKHGLACDNLVGAEIVTADGQRLRASADEHPDLLWGLRGGGGNFGVVTDFELRLHPIDTVYGGYVSYPFAQAAQVVRAYREFTAAAPDELTAFVGVLPLTVGPAFSVAACWSGDPRRGETALAPLRSFGTPDTVALRAMPLLEMQQLLSPPPIRTAAYARSSFLRALDDDAVAAMVEYAAAVPPMLGAFFVEHFHGAATRGGDSAFSNRAEAYNFAALAIWMEPEHADGSAAWVRGFSDALSPYFGSGVYSNYLGDGEGARVRAAYGSAYERLRALKRTWDPGNLFRLNQNIDPAGS
jgi:FAD/FMN-containing dehydrogenase